MSEAQDDPESPESADEAQEPAEPAADPSAGEAAPEETAEGGAPAAEDSTPAVDGDPAPADTTTEPPDDVTTAAPDDTTIEPPSTTTTAPSTTTTAPSTTTTAPSTTTTAPSTTTTAPSTTTTAPSTTTTAPSTTTTAPSTTTTAPSTTTTAPSTTTTAPSTTTTAPSTTTTAPSTTTTAPSTTTTAPSTTTTAPSTTTTAPSTTTTAPSTTTTASAPEVTSFTGVPADEDSVPQNPQSLQVEIGEPVLLSWDTSGADGVELTDPASGGQSLSAKGTLTVTPQDDEQDYLLVAVCGDQRSDPSTVHVSTHAEGEPYSPHAEVHAPPAIDSIQADKEKYERGDMATISWSLSGGEIESMTLVTKDQTYELEPETTTYVIEVKGSWFSDDAIAKEREIEVTLKVEGPGGEAEKELAIEVGGEEEMTVDLEAEAVLWETPKLTKTFGPYTVELGVEAVAKGTLKIKPGSDGKPTKEEALAKVKESGSAKFNGGILTAQLNSLSFNGNLGLNNFKIFGGKKSKEGWGGEVMSVDVFSGSLQDPFDQTVVEVKGSIAAFSWEGAGVKAIPLTVEAAFPVAALELGDDRIAIEGGIEMAVVGEGSFSSEELVKKLEEEDEANENEEDETNDEDKPNDEEKPNEDEPTEEKPDTEPDGEPDADPAGDGASDAATDGASDAATDGATDAATDAATDTAADVATDAEVTADAIVGADAAVVGGFLAIGVSLIACSVISIKETEDIVKTKGDCDELANQLGQCFRSGVKGNDKPWFLGYSAVHSRMFDQGHTNYESCISHVKEKNPDASDDDIKAAVDAHVDEACNAAAGTILAVARQTVWEAFASSHVDGRFLNYEEDRWYAWSNIYGDDPRGCAEYAKFRNEHSTKRLGM